MINSLQTRLLLAGGLIAIAAVAAVGFSARQSTRVEFDRFQTLERTREAGDGAPLARIVETLNGRCCESAAVAAARATLGPRQILLIFDSAGALVASAGTSGDASVRRATSRGDALDVDIEDGTAESNERTLLSMTLRGSPAATIRMASGESASVHVVTLPLPERERPAAKFLGSIDRRLLWITIVGAALALLGTWVMARRIVGPIAELSDATRDVAAGNLSRRVPDRGADEISELGRSFNLMTAELERQRELRQNLVRDVAHELRTPLTALQCRVEAAIDGLGGDPATALRQVGDEVGHLSRLVSDLEEIARAEARETPLHLTDTNVAEICHSAVRAAGLETDARLRIQLAPDLVVLADVGRTRQIVLNLLTNADRHTPHGGTITIRGTARAGAVGIDVHNTGSALSREEQERVFDRFYRADDARQRATGGSGLGLAIVKHLTELQGGRVWVSSDETGVTFGVEFRTETDQVRS